MDLADHVTSLDIPDPTPGSLTIFPYQLRVWEGAADKPPRLAVFVLKSLSDEAAATLMHQVVPAI